MAIHPLAGQPAPASVLVDVSKLIAAYFSEKPDTTVREQRVAFGTSGHRGSSFKRSFNEWHILAIVRNEWPWARPKLKVSRSSALMCL
jgi:phosphoglucomutase